MSCAGVSVPSEQVLWQCKSARKSVIRDPIGNESNFWLEVDPCFVFDIVLNVLNELLEIFCLRAASIDKEVSVKFRN